MLLILATVLVPLLGKAKDNDATIWALYVALCLTNPFIYSNSNEIGNYAISLFFLSVSVAIVSMPGSALWRGFLACAAIGLAVSAKLYFIVICPGILLMFLLSDECARQPKVITGCVVGILFGCAPILYFLILDYQSFLKWNVIVHEQILNVRQMEGVVTLRRIAKGTSLFVLQMSIPIAFFVAAWGQAA